MFEIKPENKYIAITEDKQCVLTGTAKSGYTVSLITEKTRKKLRFFRTKKAVEMFWSYNIRITPAVEEKYGAERYYDIHKIPKFVPVKVVCNYKVEEL